MALFDQPEQLIPFTFDYSAHGINPVRETACVHDLKDLGYLMAYAAPGTKRDNTEFYQHGISSFYPSCAFRLYGFHVRYKKDIREEAKNKGTNTAVCPF
jgi:hypothetical protein